VTELFSAIKVGGEAEAGGGIITRNVEISESGGIGIRRVG